MSDESPLNELQSSTRMLAHDIVALADLQLQLFRADGREMARQAAPKLVMAAVGVVIAASSLPLLMVGLAYALVELAEFPIWAAMLSSAVIGIIIGAVTVIVGIKRLQPLSGIWQRSTGELRENVEFLKETLRTPAP
jgi:uncharacterized membrane protein YqjE